MNYRRPDQDPARPVYVISVAASLVRVHPRTLRIYEDEGLVCPARTPTNIRLYSEEDIRRVLWIRHLTQARGVNLAGVRILFELEERLGARILETLFDEGNASEPADDRPAEPAKPDRPDPSTKAGPGQDAPSHRSGRMAAPQETR
jgi:MerR family transcriptional regulator/heat shock protein HspR